MLRTLIFCLALGLAGAARAQECAYRQPPMSEDMRKVQEMAKTDGSPFGVVMLLRTITEKEPGNAIAWRWRGVAESRAGEPVSAMEAFSKAIDLDPCDANSRMARADFAMRKGILRMAYDDYTAILARQPKNHVVLKARGDLLMSAAEFNAALADFDAALAAGSTDVDLLLDRGGLMQEFGRFHEAIADYEKILAADKENVEALVARGYSRFLLGDFAAAEPDLAAGATINPNASAWVFLARARLGAGDAAQRFVADMAKLPRESWIADAAKLLAANAADDQILQLAGDDGEKRCDAYFYLGELALAKADRARAKMLFEAGADACPKDPARTGGSLREYVAMAEELKRMR